MPKLLKARPPTGSEEEQRLRKLAGSKRAPAALVARARTIVQSWAGADTATIAARVGCHPQTVRDRIARFNADGVESVVDASSGGRKPRLTDRQRRELVAMVERLTAGEPSDQVLGATLPGGHGPVIVRRPVTWSLDALVAAVRSTGIEIGRSQLRRVLLESGLQWHPTHSWSARPASAPKREQPGPYGREAMSTGNE